MSIIPSLTNLFYEFDRYSKGYLTVSEVQRLHNELYFESIDVEHISRGLQKLTGAKDTQITLPVLSRLLLELKNRTILENDIRWAFRSMSDINRTIRIDNALVLFRACFCEKFRVKIWRDFLESRGQKLRSSAVCFDELKFWLIDDYAEMEGEPPTEQWFEKEKQELLKEVEGKEREQVDRYLKLDSDLLQSANAKRFREDQYKQFEELSTSGDDDVSYGNTINLIEYKYSILRDSILTAMSLLSSKDGSCNSAFESLRRTEVELRERGHLVEEISSLGEVHSHPCHFDISLLMDSLEGAEDQVSDQLVSVYPGESSFGEVLVALWTREAREKEDLKSWLLSSGVPEGGEEGGQSRVSEAYCRLLKQVRIFRECGEDVQCALMCVGLAERPQKYTPGREFLSLDRYRAELVSHSELVQSAAALSVPGPAQIKAVPERIGRRYLLSEIVHQLVDSTHKERKALGYFFNGVQATSSLKEARKLTPEDREKRLQKIWLERGEWKDQESGSLQFSAEINHSLLQEAVALRWAKDQDAEIEKAPQKLIASLRERQDEIFDDVIGQIPLMMSEDLLRVRYEVALADKSRTYDNLAFVVFEGCESSNDQLIQGSVRRKYAALKRKIFEEICRYNYEQNQPSSSPSSTNWNSLDMERRDRLVCKLIGREFLLRKRKSVKEIEDLIPGPLEKTLSQYSLLIGPSRPMVDQLKFISERKSGKGSKIQDYMIGYVGKLSNNALTGLGQREEQEIRDLFETRDAFRKDLLLQRLSLETQYICMEMDFNTAFIVAGLLERVNDFSDKSQFRCRSDTNRVKQLSDRQFKNRTSQAQDYTRLLQSNQDDFPTQYLEDSEMIWFQLFMKHLYERDFVTAPSEKQLRRELTTNEKNLEQRFTEIVEKHGRLRFQNEGDADKSLLYISQIITCWLILMQKRSISADVSKNLEYLREALELVQMKEVEHVFQAQLKMTESQREGEANRLYKERRMNVANNIFTALRQTFDQTNSSKENPLSYKIEQSEEDEIAEQVRAKYDTLRNQVYLDGLIKEQDSNAWKNLSPQQRQDLFDERKLLIGRLEREGRLEELDRLVESSILDERGEEVITNLKAEVEDEESADEPPKNILDQLEHNSDKELEEILRKLRDSTDQHEREQLRQAALLKLRREGRLLGRENSLLAMSMLLGLEDEEKRLSNQRERYLQLARERLAARRALKTTSDVTKELLRVSSSSALPTLEAVLAQLDANQAYERNQLIELMDDEKTAEWFSETLSDHSYNDLIVELKVLWQSYLDAQQDAGSLGGSTDLILKKACAIQLAISKLASDTDIDEIKILQLCNLQIMQELSRKKITDQLAIISDDEKQLQEFLSALTTSRPNDLISLIFVGLDTQVLTKDSIEVEVEKKYELIRNTILKQAMIAEAGGESKWKKLPEDVRRDRLARFKVEHKRLIDAGDDLEAKNMLNDLLEADKIDEVAVVNRRNILEDLDRNCEDEKARLLKQFSDQMSSHEKERKRQMIIAKLRLEQKQLQQEHSLIAFQLLLGCKSAEAAHNEDLNDARKRATDQLEQERRRRREKKEHANEDLPAPLANVCGEENEATIQETIDHIIECHGKMLQLEEELLISGLNDVIERPKKVDNLFKKSKEDLVKSLKSLEEKLTSLPQPTSSNSSDDPKCQKAYAKEAGQLRSKRMKLLTEAGQVKIALTMQIFNEDVHSAAVRLVATLSHVQARERVSMEMKVAEEQDPANLRQMVTEEWSNLMEGGCQRLRELVFGGDIAFVADTLEEANIADPVPPLERERTQDQMTSILQRNEESKRRHLNEKRRQQIKMETLLSQITKSHSPMQHHILNKHKEQQRLMEQSHQDSLKQKIERLKNRRSNLKIRRNSLFITTGGN